MSTTHERITEDGRSADPEPSETDEPDDHPSSTRLAWLLVIAGAIGLIAAGTLLVEKIAILRDSSYVPSCSINPVLSCGSIMRTEQAEVFGFPNPILGVAGFAIVITVGAALLARAEFATWFWRGLQVGTIAGVVFIHWLLWQSLYVIGALCPYCMVVWVVTMAIFFAVTARNLRTGALPGPRALADWVGLAMFAWVLLVLALITVRFWNYWSTLLPG